MSETVWASAQLGQIASVITKGTTPTTYGHHYVPDGVLFLRVENITSGGRIDLNQVLHIDKRTHAFLARSQLVAGDLLVSIAGSIGRSAVVGEDHVPANCNQAIALIRLDESKAIASFVRSFLASARGQRALLNDAVQLAQANLSLNQIAKTCILLPPIATQHSITTILDTIDEAIANTEAVIAKLKQVRAGLLHDLLTRGLDENGQLRDPIAHPEQFQDSPIGKIPRGWRISTLGAELPLQRGFDITVAQQRQGQIPVVSSSGITSFHDTAMVDGPGVVTGRKGKLGAVFYIDRDFWPHDTSLWVTDFRGNSVKFAALLLSQLRLERFDAATSVPTLNRNTIHPLQLTFPSRSEQEQLVSIVETWDESLDSEYKWLDKLQLLKSALMTDLLTGRVRVPADLDFG